MENDLVRCESIQMSNEDLIKRGDVEGARYELIRTLNYINLSGTLDYADYCELFDTIEREFDALKAVPHEMSAVEYDRERRRMCEQYGYCSVSCPLHDFDAGCMTYEPITQEAQNIVEKWAREHPEERSEDDE